MKKQFSTAYSAWLKLFLRSSHLELEWYSFSVVLALTLHHFLGKLKKFDIRSFTSTRRHYWREKITVSFTRYRVTRVEILAEKKKIGKRKNRNVLHRGEFVKEESIRLSFLIKTWRRKMKYSRIHLTRQCHIFQYQFTDYSYTLYDNVLCQLKFRSNTRDGLMSPLVGLLILK